MPSAHANASILVIVIDNSVGNVVYDLDSLDNLDITASLVAFPIPNEVGNDVLCNENIYVVNIYSFHVPIWWVLMPSEIELSLL